MVTKKRNRSATEKGGKKKVNDLKLDKETVKDLTDSEAKRIQGGRAISARCTGPTSCGCTPTVLCPLTLDCVVKK